MKEKSQLRAKAAGSRQISVGDDVLSPTLRNVTGNFNNLANIAASELKQKKGHLKIENSSNFSTDLMDLETNIGNYADELSIVQNIRINQTFFIKNKPLNFQVKKSFFNVLHLDDENFHHLAARSMLKEVLNTKPATFTLKYNELVVDKNVSIEITISKILEKLKTSETDVIISDVDMGNFSGFMTILLLRGIYPNKISNLTSWLRQDLNKNEASIFEDFFKPLNDNINSLHAIDTEMVSKISPIVTKARKIPIIILSANNEGNKNLHKLIEFANILPDVAPIKFCEKGSKDKDIFFTLIKKILTTKNKVDHKNISNDKELIIQLKK